MLPEYTFTPKPPPVHQPGSSLNSILLGFYGGFHYIGMIIKSWAPGNSFNLQSCSPQRPREWDCKFQTSNDRVGSSGDHPPSLSDLEISQKVNINITKDTFLALLIGNFKGLGALCHDWNKKQICIFFFFINHNITVHLTLLYMRMRV